jgi:hypothetical protein
VTDGYHIHIRRLELNGPDVTLPHAWLAQLVGFGADLIITGINRWAVREQGKIPATRCAIIGEVPELGIASQVCFEQGDSTASGIADEVMAL